MVYSTCSILKEENEGLLKRVLKSSGGELVPIGEEWTKRNFHYLNAMPGRSSWGPNDLFEGFFVAKIRKIEAPRGVSIFYKNALSFYAAPAVLNPIRFSSGKIVISIVRMQAVPPMTLETGSARNTPSVPICMA